VKSVRQEEMETTGGKRDYGG